MSLLPKYRTSLERYNYLFILCFFVVSVVSTNLYAQSPVEPPSQAPSTTAPQAPAACNCSCNCTDPVPSTPTQAPLPTTVSSPTQCGPFAGDKGQGKGGISTHSPLLDRHVGADFIKRSGRFGIGVTGGLPSVDLSVKVYILKNMSLMLNIPYYYLNYYSGTPSYGIFLDLLYETDPFYRGENVDLAWQVGAGAGASFRQDFKAVSPVFNFNLGFQLLFTKVPIELTFAYQPDFLFIPHRGNVAPGFRKERELLPMLLGLNIGVRYYF